MKYFSALAGAIALAMAASPAGAADVYSSGGLKDGGGAYGSGPTNWTGFYIGGHGGYGEGLSDRDAAVTGEFTDVYVFEGGSATFKNTVTGTAAGPLPTGFLYGGQFGYLFQPAGNFVLGAEFSFSGSSVAGDKAGNMKAVDVFTYNDSFGNTFTATGPTQVTTAYHQQLDYIGTLTGVVGIPFGNIMPYVKAGLAFGQVQESLMLGGPDNGLVLSRKDVDTGWTAGGGVAWKFLPNWSLFWDWNYYDLGSHSMSYADATDFGDGHTSTTKVTTASVDETFWATKIGVNYQISSGFQPLK